MSRLVCSAKAVLKYASISSDEPPQSSQVLFAPGRLNIDQRC
jgi:hypothetical protein